MYPYRTYKNPALYDSDEEGIAACLERCERLGEDIDIMKLANGEIHNIRTFALDHYHANGAVTLVQYRMVPTITRLA